MAAVGAAGDKHWVLSSSELQAVGWTGRQIRHAADSGFLFRQYDEVYAVGRPVLPFEGRCRAAVLASGPGSAVSHITAAARWGFRRTSGRIHVSVPRGRRGHPGLLVHRPRSLRLADIRVSDGITQTSVARTLLDMSAGASVETVGGWIHEALVQRVLDFREVLEVIERLRHHRGRRVLEAALAAEVVDTRTRLETRVLALWRQAGLPEPRANVHVWSTDRLEEVDLVSTQLGLIVEADGTAVHASRWRRRRDAEKTARLRAAGWTVIRVAELRATLEPASVVAELRAAASAGRSKRQPLALG